MRPAKKKCITCKVLHSTAHGISHSISATYMSWVHFDYRWFPRVSLESPSPTVSTSALWRVQTLTLYSHMQMKLHMHDEKYDVDIFAACSQLEILRRKKKVIRCWPKAIIEAIIEAAARYKIHMEHLHSRPVPAEPRAGHARLELSAVVAPWPCVAPFLPSICDAFYLRGRTELVPCRTLDHGSAAHRRTNPLLRAERSQLSQLPQNFPTPCMPHTSILLVLAARYVASRIRCKKLVLSLVIASSSLVHHLALDCFLASTVLWDCASFRITPETPLLRCWCSSLKVQLRVLATLLTHMELLDFHQWYATHQERLPLNRPQSSLHLLSIDHLLRRLRLSSSFFPSSPMCRISAAFFVESSQRIRDLLGIYALLHRPFSYPSLTLWRSLGLLCRDIQAWADDRLFVARLSMTMIDIGCFSVARLAMMMIDMTTVALITMIEPLI